MLEIAHRGYSETLTNNSLDAFKSAVKYNFDMIELDIQLCSSGEIIVFHDIFIKNKLVHSLSFNDLGEISNDIITLNTFFENIDTSKIKIYLDLKGPVQLAHKLIQFFINNNINLEPIYIASFNRKHLQILNESKLNLKLGFISDNAFMSNELDIMLKELHFFSINWIMLDNDTIQYCKNKNIKIFVYTMSCLDDWKHFKNLNVDGIITNLKLPPSHPTFGSQKK